MRKMTQRSLVVMMEGKVRKGIKLGDVFDVEALNT